MTNIDNHLLWGGKRYFSTLFARVFLWLTIGILFAEYSQLSYSFFITTTAISVLLIIISTLRGSRLGEWFFVAALPVALLSLGGLLLSIKEAEVGTEVCDDYQTMVVDVVSVPIEKTKFYKCEAVVRFAAVGDSLAGVDRGEKLVLNFEADSAAAVAPKLGDRFMVSTRVSLPKPLYEGAFDYGRFLYRQGFAGVGWVDAQRCRLLSENNLTGVRMHMLKLRGMLIDRYEAVGIGGEELSVLSAITLGEKGMLSDDTKSHFNAGGVSHVLVVSGMHVGFIYLIIMMVMRRVMRPAGRLLCLLGGLAVLWFYALLSGFAPSIVRATFMFTMMLIMRVRGDSYRVENALFLSAIILVMNNPFVIFDIGFQLSYTAVISIVYFMPYFSRAIRKMRLYRSRPQRVLESLLMTIAVTLSAQILTMPIVLFNFNQFPIYFVLTNLVVSVLAPVIFIGGLALIPLSYVPWVGAVGGWLMSYVLRALEWCVEFVSSMPMAVVGEYVSGVECVLLYVVILAVVNLMETYRFYNVRFASVVFLLLAVLAFGITTAYNDWSLRNCEKMIIFGGGGSTVNLISAGENIVYSQDDGDFVKSRLEPLWLKHNAPEPVFVSDSALGANSFVFKDDLYMIMRGNRFRYKKNPPAAMQVDCIIIDKGIYPSERLFDEFVDAKRVILTQSVWHGYHEKFRELTASRNIKLEILD